MVIHDVVLGDGVQEFTIGRMGNGTSHLVNTSQIEGRAARVVASPTRGYLTQVIDPKTMPKVALPPLLRERQPEDFEGE